MGSVRGVSGCAGTCGAAPGDRFLGRVPQGDESDVVKAFLIISESYADSEPIDRWCGLANFYMPAIANVY